MLAAVLLCTLSACAGGDQGAGAPPSSSATTSSSTTTTSTSTTGTTPSTSATPGGRMTSGLSSPVVLERSGGIAGRLDRLEVRPDGTYTLSSRGGRPVTRQLTEAELVPIVDAARAAHLGSQSAASRPGAAEADVFRYRLVAEGERLVTTEQQADGAVRQLIDVLMPLFSSPAPTP
jgi:hypothetical protein